MYDEYNQINFANQYSLNPGTKEIIQNELIANGVQPVSLDKPVKLSPKKMEDLNPKTIRLKVKVNYKVNNKVSDKLETMGLKGGMTKILADKDLNKHGIATGVAAAPKEIDPNAYYIIEFNDDGTFQISGDKTPFPTKEDAEAYNLRNPLDKKTKVNKGSTIIQKTGSSLIK